MRVREITVCEGIHCDFTIRVTVSVSVSVRAFMVSVRPVCHCDFAIRINGECVRVHGGYPLGFHDSTSGEGR